MITSVFLCVAALFGGISPNTRHINPIQVFDPPTAPATKNLLSSTDTTILNDFASAMLFVAGKYHATVICEDAPAKTLLSSPQFVALKEKLDAAGMTMEETVSSIARAYDYEPNWLKPNLCLLRKRYTEENDIPRIPLEELVASLRNIQTLFAQVKTDNPGGYAKRLNVFGEETLARLDKKKVRVSELSPSAQTFLWDIATSQIPGQPVADLRRITGRLDTCLSGDASLRLETYDGFTFPAYVGTFSSFRGKSIVNRVAISSAFFTGAGGATYIDPPSTVYQQKDVKKGLSDFVANDPVTNQPKRPVPIKIAQWKTIAEEVSLLSKRWSDPIPLVTDPILAAKGLCVFGEEYNEPAQIAEGVAQLYDLRYAKWRVTKDAPPQWRIMLHAIKRPMPGEDVSAMVWQQIPLPLRNCFLQDENGGRVAMWSEVQEKKYGQSTWKA